MRAKTAQSQFFTTSDGVRLHYLEAGQGPTLVMIPGWSQAAEQFCYQIEGLSDRFHCIALDMRGHGESDKVDYGYKISRFAKDVSEVLTGLELSDVALLGHSMGCSVMWAYWDMFGPERLSKLILTDQSPFLTASPTWSETERLAAGAAFDLEGVVKNVNALAGPDGATISGKLLRNMVTRNMSDAEFDWMLECNLKLPRQHAAALLLNHCTQDWRDVIPRITLPTLVVGGKISVVPWQSQVWIHEQIPSSQLVVFEESEGGQHFMFIEGADKFNQVVASFMA